MKTGVEHRVPLSSAALRILEQARPLSDGKGLVFPSARRGKQIATRTLLLLLSAHVDATVHGFRGSFKNWTAETGVQREVAEAALAHTVENQVEAAYLTTDLFVARAAVMQAWSDYLTC